MFILLIFCAGPIDWAALDKIANTDLDDDADEDLDDDDPDLQVFC